MEKQYYITELHLDSQTNYLIWVLDEIDGLVTNPLAKNLRLLTFTDKSNLLKFSRINGLIIVEEEPAKYDLNLIANWLKNPNGTIDCKKFLDAWNLFTDVVTTLEIEFEGNKKEKIRNRIYNKLFLGINIPAITPQGQEYNPNWNKIEINRLAGIMNEGLEILRRSLQ